MRILINKSILILGIFFMIAQLSLAQTYTLERSMNLNEAMSFSSKLEHGIKINKSGTGWKVEVRLQSAVQHTWSAGINCNDTYLNEKVSLFGEQVTSNTNGQYSSEPLPEGQNYERYKPGFFCWGVRTSSSNNRYRLRRNAWLLKTKTYEYFEANKWQANTAPVLITVTLTGGVTLSEIEGIKIPGLGIITQADFIDNNDTAQRIEVYRGSNILPIRTINFADFANSNLVVYEGDSLVFRNNLPTSVTRVTGLTDIAIARWAGESIFMTEEDIGSSNNEHKPFLFFDSNVHGVKMRTYPENWKGETIYPGWTYASGKWTKYWIANRRRDFLMTDELVNDHTNVALSAYKTAAEFNSNGFPNKNKFSGDNESLPIQRNNQKEGLNVELLDAYDFGFGGVAGLDPDELIYKNFNSSDIIGDAAARDRDFTYVTKDRWKEIDQADSHINATLIKSLARMRRFITGNDDAYYRGHEILDNNLFIHKNTIEIIEGANFDYGIPQPMFNNKRPIVFNPLKTNKPLVHHTSRLSWTINGVTKEINFAVLSPLEGKRYNRNYDDLNNNMRINPLVNFYGIIDGPTFVARNQENVRYSVEDLPTSTEVPGTFELVYTYEDSNGFLNETRKVVSSNPNYIDIKFGGGGYHEITLQYKRNKDENTTPVIIAGKELVDVDLRFIFSPNAEDANDFSNNPLVTFGNQSTNLIGVERLFENKGSGKKWFLDDENPRMKENDYGLEHGYKDHNVVRTYALNKDQNLTLSVLDADPHSFTHYQPDWYLSERRLSKRVSDNELGSYNGQHKIEWFASTNVDFSAAISLGLGKHKNISPLAIYGANDTPSTIYVKAVYNNTSEIKVKFKLRDLADNLGQIISAADQNIGVVKSYPLSEFQFDLIREMPGDQIDGNKEDYRIFAVQDLLSSYEYNSDRSDRYIDPALGNTIRAVGEHQRFSLKNNFDARFNMTFRKSPDGPTINFIDISYDFTDATDPTLLDWFPHNWIRHLDGEPQSPEIPIFSNASYITAFNQLGDPNIRDYVFDGVLYEPWQVRLPWIAQTGLYGYKTRWNIKTIFDIDMLFNRSEVGNAYRVPGHTTADYQNAVNGINGINIIRNYTLDNREAQEFFWHLKTGRMVIIEIAKLKNANDNNDYAYVTVTNNKKGAALGLEIYKGNVYTTTTGTGSKTANIKESAISKTDFSIYPNPINDGRFSLEFALREKGLASFEIFNIAGQLMFQKKNQNLDQGNHKIEFEKSDVNLASGVYLLKVVTNEFTETRKLFVE
jgi:hypothetical protein